MRSAEDALAALEPCKHKKGMPCPVCGRGKGELMRWMVESMIRAEDTLLGPSKGGHTIGLYEERLLQLGLLFRRETK